MAVVVLPTQFQPGTHLSPEMVGGSRMVTVSGTGVLALDGAVDISIETWTQDGWESRHGFSFQGPGSFSTTAPVPAGRARARTTIAKKPYQISVEVS